MTRPSFPQGGRLRPGAETTVHPASAALTYALNVHRAVDRRSPEATELVRWLLHVAPTFGIFSGVPSRLSNSGFGASAWNRIGAVMEQAQQAIAQAQAQGEPSVAERWIAAICKATRLDAWERQILTLALYYRHDERLEGLFDHMSASRGGAQQFNNDMGLIALLTNVPAAAAAERLGPSGRLFASGLLRTDANGALSLPERLKSLIRRQVRPRLDPYDQLLGTLTGKPLPWEAFAHLGPEGETAARLLGAALEQKTAINLLLYGPPGTGKSAFAAALGGRVGARLRPVMEADENGDEPSRSERLAGLRLAQHLGRPGRDLLLFDEAEDLFTAFSDRWSQGTQTSRVYMHQLLETARIPVIWTANDIGRLGPAVLRRMTMCLHLKIPPVAVRARLWGEMAAAEGVALTEADAARLARLVPAAPAVAATALRATRLIGGDATTARLIVEGVARAVAGGALPAPEMDHDALYEPDLLNADADLRALAERLTGQSPVPAVSLLLSGPPGSGKSAWVRHLAARMGLPVLQKRASDLLDRYVGGTERAIAAAFAEARDTGAFLVFDEADSLLLERGHAERSWEISQVNEMLTWMEQHPLPFACTTNLLTRLDRASLRRFMVKLRFDWLTPAQIRLAFRRFFDLPAPVGLDRLTTLTPADFALVRRRAAVSGAQDAGDLTRLLAAECEGRDGGRAPVGFLPRAAA